MGQVLRFQRKQSGGSMEAESGKPERKQRPWTRFPLDVLRELFRLNRDRYSDDRPATDAEAWMEYAYLLESGELNDPVLGHSLEQLRERWHWSSRSKVYRLAERVKAHFAELEEIRNNRGTAPEQSRNNTGTAPEQQSTENQGVSTRKRNSRGTAAKQHRNSTGTDPNTNAHVRDADSEISDEQMGEGEGRTPSPTPAPVEQRSPPAASLPADWQRLIGHRPDFAHLPREVAKMKLEDGKIDRRPMVKAFIREIESLWDRWRTDPFYCDRPERARLTATRLEKLVDRLQDSGVDELVEALDGAKLHQWQQEHPEHRDLVTVFRDRIQVEKFGRLVRRAGKSEGRIAYGSRGAFPPEMMRDPNDTSEDEPF